MPNSPQRPQRSLDRRQEGGRTLWQRVVVLLLILGGLAGCVTAKPMAVGLLGDVSDLHRVSPPWIQVDIFLAKRGMLPAALGRYARLHLESAILIGADGATDSFVSQQRPFRTALTRHLQQRFALAAVDGEGVLKLRVALAGVERSGRGLSLTDAPGKAMMVVELRDGATDGRLVAWLDRHVALTNRTRRKPLESAAERVDDLLRRLLPGEAGIREAGAK